MKCPVCKKTKSGKGRPFDRQSLAQHMRDVHDVRHQEDEDAEFELTDMIAGDEPDGVYFAIAWELGEL